MALGRTILRYAQWLWGAPSQLAVCRIIMPSLDTHPSANSINPLVTKCTSSRDVNPCHDSDVKASTSKLMWFKRNNCSLPTVQYKMFSRLPLSETISKLASSEGEQHRPSSHRRLCAHLRAKSFHLCMKYVPFSLLSLITS